MHHARSDHMHVWTPTIYPKFQTCTHQSADSWLYPNHGPALTLDHFFQFRYLKHACPCPACHHKIKHSSIHHHPSGSFVPFTNQGAGLCVLPTWRTTEQSSHTTASLRPKEHEKGSTIHEHLVPLSPN